MLFGVANLRLAVYLTVNQATDRQPLRGNQCYSVPNYYHHLVFSIMRHHDLLGLYAFVGLYNQAVGAGGEGFGIYGVAGVGGVGGLLRYFFA